MKASSMLLFATSAVAQSASQLGANNCNVCVQSSSPMMYCPDGSCVSMVDNTCSTSGTIYTENTGCRATSQCDVGNRGLIVIGETDHLYETQGGYDFSGKVSFSAPTKNPCAIMVRNPHDVAITFWTAESSGYSWYALQLDTPTSSDYDEVNVKNNFIIEPSSDYALFYFGSTQSGATDVNLSWQITSGQKPLSQGHSEEHSSWTQNMLSRGQAAFDYLASFA